jgi:hypothetical protein
MYTQVKEVVQVTPTQMVEIFREIENQTPTPFVNVTMKTLYTDVLKKCKEDGSINPYYKGIYKISKKTYRLVTDYEKRVKKNLQNEGKDPNQFVVEPPKGKKHISKSCLTDVKTENELYVMLEWFPETKGKTEYEFNNDPIGKELFEKWISKSESSNQKQGLDREVTPITPNIKNILEVNVNGMSYRIV